MCLCEIVCKCVEITVCENCYMCWNLRNGMCVSECAGVREIPWIDVYWIRYVCLCVGKCIVPMRASVWYNCNIGCHFTNYYPLDAYLPLWNMIIQEVMYLGSQNIFIIWIPPIWFLCFSSLYHRTSLIFGFSNGEDKTSTWLLS